LRRGAQSSTTFGFYGLVEGREMKCGRCGRRL